MNDELTKAKTQLYRLLLAQPNSALSDNELTLMEALAADDAIQQALEVSVAYARANVGGRR